MSYKYKNVSESDQALIGHGYVKPGESIETDTVIENPNFKYEGEVTTGTLIEAVTQPQDNAVTEANLIEPTQIEEQI